MGNRSVFPEKTMEYLEFLRSSSFQAFINRIILDNRAIGELNLMLIVVNLGETSLNFWFLEKWVDRGYLCVYAKIESIKTCIGYVQLIYIFKKKRHEIFKVYLKNISLVKLHKVIKMKKIWFVFYRVLCIFLRVLNFLMDVNKILNIK